MTDKMTNAILMLPLLSFEWDKGGRKCITFGWLKWTYSVYWGLKERKEETR